MTKLDAQPLKKSKTIEYSPEEFAAELPILEYIGKFPALGRIIPVEKVDPSELKVTYRTQEGAEVS